MGELTDGTIIFYWLGSVYIVLTVAATLLLVKTFLPGRHHKFAILPRVIYSVSLAFCAERSILCFVIPTPFLFGITRDHRWLIVLIDMLPEIMAFSVYLLLLFFVAKLYHTSKKPRPNATVTLMNRNERRELIFWSVFGAIVAVPVVCVIVYSALQSRFANPHPYYAEWDYHVQTSFIAVLAAFLIVAFLLYGALLYKSLGKFAHSKQKATIIRKLHILIIACLIFSTLHAVMNGVFNEHMRKDPNRDTKKGLYLAWAAIYFALTEAVPFACILAIVGTLFRSDKSREGSSLRMSEIPGSRSRAPTAESVTTTYTRSRTASKGSEEGPLQKSGNSLV